MTGRNRHSIIDFVTEKDGMRTCWQLLASVHETELFEEKLKALESLDDNCDRVMMTLDPQAELPEGNSVSGTAVVSAGKGMNL